MPSVVIPAHDEASTIGALLDELAPLHPDVKVVVVCNGCSDDTAEVARRHAPWAVVAELEQASKPAALDEGDRLAKSFPRVYVDADVRISSVDVRRLIELVDRGDLDAAAATPVYDLSDSSWFVRSHYRIWTRQQDRPSQIAGTNAMAVSEGLRRRFGQWPRVIGDDYFLDGVAADLTARRSPEATVQRSAPRGFRDCVSRKARIHQGNREVVETSLRTRHVGGGLLGALDAVRKEPRLLPDLPAHLVVTVASRLLAATRRRRGTAGTWYRDRSRAVTTSR